MVVDSGSGKSCLVFGSDLTAHAVFKICLMIIGKKRNFVQIWSSIAEFVIIRLIPKFMWWYIMVQGKAVFFLEVI